VSDTARGEGGPRYLVDWYEEWVKGEGVPVVEDFGVDLLSVETADWPRLGASGAFVHLKGRGDFISVTLVEMRPGGSTAPQRHLYEEVVYVLSGRGATTVESSDGSLRHSFEWGPKSMFALPLNLRYRHFNLDGKAPARLACTTNLPMVAKAFRNEEFIFNNPAEFPERHGDQRYFSGEGDFLALRPGRHMWETNFVPDLSSFELRRWEARGAGSANIMFVLADGTMHAHISEMAVGTYKKGHRHGADFHIFAVTGEGYSLLWYDPGSTVPGHMRPQSGP